MPSLYTLHLMILKAMYVAIAISELPYHFKFPCYAHAPVIDNRIDIMKNGYTIIFCHFKKRFKLIFCIQLKS